MLNKKAQMAAMTKLLVGLSGIGILYLALSPAAIFGSFKLVNLLSNPLFIFVGIIAVILIFSGGKK